MLSNLKTQTSAWIVRLFVSTVESIQRPDEKIEALNWLSASREIVASRASATAKLTALYRNLDARRSVVIVFSSVTGAVKKYAKSDLPLAAKIAVPATLLSIPFVAGQGAGIAAFGTAIGVPVLLLIFIGAAGITSILEACATSESARAYTRYMLSRIAKDEAFRAFRAAMRRGEQGEPEAPMRAEMPSELVERRDALLGMEPIAFEKHVMSFFVGPHLSDAAMTQQTGDKGIDGLARHCNGLIVVQCKRYAAEHKVGSSSIREFSGAMHFHNAWRGYFVTTSRFTRDAIEIANARQNLILVDIDGLLTWPEIPPDFKVEPGL